MFHLRNCVEEIVKQENSFKWLPAIIEEFCTNGGLCVAACGPACLETQNRVTVLERPYDCGSEEHCISACPEDAIHMVWLPSEGDHSIGLWRPVAHMNPEFRSIGAASPMQL
jgi:Na+-translocating ferredoxin:NAD+ oxidoreductase RNF subunit RnfB